MEFKPLKDELFSLVKSLSQAEKRYFRRFSALHSQQKEQKYLILFDALDAMEDYSEQTLKEKCQGEKFVSQLPGAKRYLMKLILKSLRLFHQEKTVDRKLRQFLDELELLFHRGLYGSCLKRLKKAKLMAHEHDRLLLLVEILRWERRLLKKINPKVILEQLEQLDAEEKEVLKRLETELKLVQVHDHLFKTALPSLPQLPQAREDETFDAQVARNSLMGMFHQRAGEEEMAHPYFKACLTLWESHPHQLNAHPTRYLGALQNFLASCHRVCDYEDYENQLRRIRTLGGIQSSTSALVDPVIGNLELIYRLNRGQFQETQAVAELLEDRLRRSKYRGPGLNRNMIEYNLAITYFILDRPSDSLRNLEQILRRGRPQTPSLQYDLARLWEPLVQFELDNLASLPYLVRSVRRYFKKYPPEPIFAPLVLRKIIELKGKPDLDEREALFYALYQELSSLPDITGRQELLLWSQSRAERIPMQELFQRSTVST